MSSDWQSNSFEALSVGPPKRKLYIWQEQPGDGWGFSVSSFDQNDDEQPYWDAWEETYPEILRYPPDYAPMDIVWRDPVGRVVDIYKLNPLVAD